MNPKVEAKLNLFNDNFQSIRSEFVWQEPMAKRLAALAYALAGKPLDFDKIKDCHNLIKSEVGVFSSFRGMLSVYVAAALSLSNEPESLLKDTLYVYDLLKEQRFWGSEYLVVTAYEIAANAKRIDFEHMAARTRGFYDEMKSNHRFLVGGDDYIFAAMLALSGLDVHQGANKVKNIHIMLRENFSAFTSRNSMLTLAQMLALSDEPKERAYEAVKLNRALRKRKIKLDKTYTLPSLGALALLDMDSCTIADELTAACDFLRSQKGFSPWSITIQELQLYAVSLLTHSYIGDSQTTVTKAGVTTSVTNLIIAQQVAIIVAMGAASAAAASSS